MWQRQHLTFNNDDLMCIFVNINKIVWYKKNLLEISCGIVSQDMGWGSLMTSKESRAGKVRCVLLHGDRTDHWLNPRSSYWIGILTLHHLAEFLSIERLQQRVREWVNLWMMQSLLGVWATWAGLPSRSRIYLNAKWVSEQNTSKNIQAGI